MELLGFDKYAPYLLTVYGLAIVLLVANSWLSASELKKVTARALRRVQHAAGKSGEGAPS